MQYQLLLRFSQSHFPAVVTDVNVRVEERKEQQRTGDRTPPVRCL